MKDNNANQSIHMQYIFPFIVDIELEVVQKYGYNGPEGYGVVEFTKEARK